MRRVLALGLTAWAPLASAQVAPQNVPPPPPPPAATAAATAPPAAAPSATGAPPTAPTPGKDRAPEAEPKKPVRPATGYGWSRRAPASPAAPSTQRPRGKVRSAARPKKEVTEVWQPGFEPQPGETSTFFVNLSRKSQVEVKKSEDRLVYVIKGARAALRNNRNPLLTTFFSTPVSSARLIQVKDDVQLVLALKRPATATWAFAPAGPLVQLRVSFGPQKGQPEAVGAADPDADKARGGQEGEGGADTEETEETDETGDTDRK